MRRTGRGSSSLLAKSCGHDETFRRLFEFHSGFTREASGGLLEARQGGYVQHTSVHGPVLTPAPEGARSPRRARSRDESTRKQDNIVVYCCIESTYTQIFVLRQVSEDGDLSAGRFTSRINGACVPVEIRWLLPQLKPTRRLPSLGARTHAHARDLPLAACVECADGPPSASRRARRASRDQRPLSRDS